MNDTTKSLVKVIGVGIIVVLMSAVLTLFAIILKQQDELDDKLFKATFKPLITEEHDMRMREMVIKHSLRTSFSHLRTEAFFNISQKDISHIDPNKIIEVRLIDGNLINIGYLDESNFFHTIFEYERINQ